MLCLGPKQSLTSPRRELTAQGVVYQCSLVECEDHSAIQAPQLIKCFNLYTANSKQMFHYPVNGWNRIWVL